VLGITKMSVSAPKSWNFPVFSRLAGNFAQR
jgi:hypothetical protein